MKENQKKKEDFQTQIKNIADINISLEKEISSLKDNQKMRKQKKIINISDKNMSQKKI